MKYVSIKNQQILFAIFGSLIYLLISLFVSFPSQGIAASFIMSLNFFITFAFLLDFAAGLLNISNLFFIFFELIGMYLRFIVIAIDPKRLTSFLVVRVFENMPEYHIKAAIALLVFNLCFLLGKKSVFIKRSENNVDTEEPLYKNDLKVGVLVNIVYILFTCIYIIHAILNISRLKVGVEEISTWDNFYNSIGALCHLIAYMHFALYCEKGKKENLILSFLFIIPYSSISLLLLSKGVIIFELLMILVIYSQYKKVKIRVFVYLFIAFAIVFPIISMARVNVQVPGKYQINIESIVEYSKENNIFIYLSDRFAYYDETYYGVNNDLELINNFREEAGNPISAFFAGLIPRSIWKDKPMVSSSYSVTFTLCALPTYIKTSLAIGYISEAYSYWGWFGVSIFALFLAKCNQAIEKLKYRKTPLDNAIYVSIGYYLINFMEGGIIAKIICILIIIVCSKMVSTLLNTRLGRY